MNDEPAPLGFVGAGVMGAPMIANLVAAGHPVRAYGRSAGSRARAERAGATAVDAVAAVVDRAAVVIIMVPDSPDAEAVVAQLADHLQPDQVVVDMSTVNPATARESAAILRERGIGMLDAPVSGGEQAATDGTLSIMVGGDAEVLDRVRPVLEVLGTTITHVGPHGAGQTTKAANQLIVALNLQAVAEAVVLLDAAGVDLPAALDAIGGGLAGSTVLQRKRENYLAGDHRPGFRLALHDKDLRIVAVTASEHGTVLPLTAAVTQLVRALVARGSGGLDHSAVLQLTRELNGG